MEDGKKRCDVREESLFWSFKFNFLSCRHSIAPRMQWNVNLTIFFTEPLFCSRLANVLRARTRSFDLAGSLSRTRRLSKKKKTKITPVYTLNRLPLFCDRFINHNPRDCDHATTHTLKHVVIEIMKLKSFDGHKIKCLNLKRSPYGMAGK